MINRLIPPGYGIDLDSSIPLMTFDLINNTIISVEVNKQEQINSTDRGSRVSDD